jgi:hypothetical protein
VYALLVIFGVIAGSSPRKTMEGLPFQHARIAKGRRGDWQGGK